MVLGVRRESKKGSLALEALSGVDPRVRVVELRVTATESCADELAESAIGLVLAMLMYEIGASRMNAAGEDASDAR